MKTFEEIYQLRESDEKEIICCECGCGPFLATRDTPQYEYEICDTCLHHHLYGYYDNYDNNDFNDE